MKFGNILRELREEKNLSQVELAKTLNITSQSLSQYELGKRMPDVGMIGILANYFNVSIDYLLGRTNIKETINNIVSEESKGYIANENLINTEDLSPENQKKVIEYIELLRSWEKNNLDIEE